MSIENNRDLLSETHSVAATLTLRGMGFIEQTLGRSLLAVKYLKVKPLRLLQVAAAKKRLSKGNLIPTKEGYRGAARIEKTVK